MRKVKCENGHFFNADRYDECPVCGCQAGERGTRCSNGHLFDSRRFDRCPTCGMGAETWDPPAPQEPFQAQELGATMPVFMPEDLGATMPVFTAEELGATVGILEGEMVPPMPTEGWMTSRMMGPEEIVFPEPESEVIPEPEPEVIPEPEPEVIPEPEPEVIPEPEPEVIPEPEPEVIPEPEPEVIPEPEPEVIPEPEPEVIPEPEPEVIPEPEPEVIPKPEPEVIPEPEPEVIPEPEPEVIPEPEPEVVPEPTPIPASVQVPASMPRSRTKAGLTVGWLVCVRGVYQGSTFPCKPGRNRIGGSRDSDICLELDFEVSREPNAFIIYDARKNTFHLQAGMGESLVHLNDSLVFTHEELHAYDTILLGDSEFVFLPLCGPKFSWDSYIKL